MEYRDLPCLLQIIDPSYLDVVEAAKEGEREEHCQACSFDTHVKKDYENVAQNAVKCSTEHLRVHLGL